jgi:uncharacterized SAM-binding protein YcdF (DUF218 family)
MFITGITITAKYSNKLLSDTYPPLAHAPNNVTTVVVLSGGENSLHSPNPNTNLSPITLCRTVEGIRLALDIKQQHEKPLLILAGATNTARNMQKTAQLFGIPMNNSKIDSNGKDTAKQAQSLHKTLKQRPFILVTSAVHMPRSMALFKHLNMHPIAAPTCFNYKVHNSISLLNYVPMASRITRFNYAWHEYLGLLWGKINNLL